MAPMSPTFDFRLLWMLAEPSVSSASTSAATSKTSCTTVTGAYTNTSKLKTSPKGLPVSTASSTESKTLAAPAAIDITSSTDTTFCTTNDQFTNQNRWHTSDKFPSRTAFSSQSSVHCGYPPPSTTSCCCCCCGIGGGGGCGGSVKTTLSKPSTSSTSFMLVFTLFLCALSIPCTNGQGTTEFAMPKMRQEVPGALEDLNSTLSKEIMANTSLLLDSLLSEENYDRRIRPGFGGNATKIITDVEIRSFGPVSENDMMYSMDCYFRQSWRDERLKFEGSLKKLSVSWQFLERIWTPDTYINNGKSSYLHKVSVPNKFVRLHGDGTLKYSMRLTIRAKCPMHLRKYPLDTQACPLEIGSYAYSPKDVVFHWNGKVPVVISKDVTLSQYEFVDILSDNLTVELPSGETRSTLVTRFILRRRRGYFILQIYAPCSMIVGASWVAFWINRNDAAGRVAVGSMTVLTLVTMGFGGRASLPGVNYATALDWFVIMCFTFVFTALVEYACVNYIERYMAMKQRKQLEARTKYETRHEQVRLQLEKEFRENGRDPSSVKLDLIRLRLEKEAEREEEADCQDTGFLADFRAYCRRRRRHKCIRIATQPEREDALTPHEISGEVDAWARIIFPSTFFLFMLCYWVLFLYLVDDEIDYSNPIGGMTVGVPLQVNNGNRSDSNA